MTAAVVAYIFTACLFSLAVAANSSDTLTPQNPLADDGRTLVSDGSARFELGFFSLAAGSPNRYIGIWYHNISDNKVVWVANRRRPLTARTGRLSLTTNGTLILTQGNSTVIWSSTSPTVDTPVARLLDNGNFVVAKDGRLEDPNPYAWQSFDLPTDTMLQGMKLGWNLTSRVNRNLTSWTSATDPAPGDYTLGIDVRGDPQLFMWNGTRQVWRGGSWNGLRFSGVPQMMEPGNVLRLSYDFVIDADEVAYTFRFQNPAVMSMLVMNHTGVLRRLIRVEPQSRWTDLGSEPSDRCGRQVSLCGPNSVCLDDPLACGCVQGFRDKAGRAGTSGGCVRETEVKCNQVEDSFVPVSNAKLPDTAAATVNWSMSMSLEQCKAWCSRNCSCTAYASANISGGGTGTGCIIWTGDLNDLTVYEKKRGQDLYVRQAAADSDRKSTRSPGRYLVAIIVAPILALCLALLACCVWRRKRTRRYISQETEANDLDLPIFDLSTVADATCNFSIENKLGQGGFGPVYKAIGTLGDGNEIAVKRLSKTSSQGVDEFKNEVLLIAKLQHRNLVRLLGCCIQEGERMLIYEYMSNGSLDSFLFDEVKGTLLDWQTRYNIIVGIARGLLYLHHDSRLRIIHRDLKASNVLLDKDMNPKISDFGMARIFAGEDTEVNTAKVVGTYGYMSPEYAMDGIFSVKSDVFSFGVLVLEIVSGKRNRGVYHSEVLVNLLGLTWSLWKEGKALEIAHESFGPSVPAAELLCCIKVGLLCVQERQGDRPTMNTVVKMLDSDTSSLPEPNQPGFIDLRRPFEMDSSGSKQTLSVNSVTTSTLQVR